MKKRMTILALALALCMLSAGALAAGKGLHKGNGLGKGRSFADANGDGICDNRSAGCMMQGQGRSFADENGDGICDNRSAGCMMQGRMAQRREQARRAIELDQARSEEQAADRQARMAQRREQMAEFKQRLEELKAQGGVTAENVQELIEIFRNADEDEQETDVPEAAVQETAAQGRNFTDENGDGVCDNRANGCMMQGKGRMMRRGYRGGRN